jgi:hypothetical protein
MAAFDGYSCGAALPQVQILALHRVYDIRGLKLHFMAGGKKDKRGAAPTHEAKPRDPEWTAGLKRLYDAVVEEPLPDSFRDLLNKLDAAD